MAGRFINLQALFGAQVSYQIPQFQRPYGLERIGKVISSLGRCSQPGRTSHKGDRTRPGNPSSGEQSSSDIAQVLLRRKTGQDRRLAKFLTACLLDSFSTKHELRQSRKGVLSFILPGRHEHSPRQVCAS